MSIEQAILWAMNAALAMTIVTAEKQAEDVLFQDLPFFQQHQKDNNNGYANKQFSR